MVFRSPKEIAIGLAELPANIRLSPVGRVTDLAVDNGGNESLWRALSSPFRAGAVRLDKTKFACLPLKLGGMPLGHESRTKAQETGQAEAQADSGAWNIV